MNEHSFRNTFRRLAKRFDPEMYVWKTHDDYEGGVPDFFLERKNTERWVEIKYLKALPKRDSTVIDFCDPKRWLSDLQQQWLARRESNFGDASLVVGFGESRCEAILYLPDSRWETKYTTGEVKGMLIMPDQLFPSLFNE